MSRTPRSPADTFNVSTLTDAHTVMRNRRPGPGASLEDWLAYRQYGVKLYTHVSDIDRGHHYEALQYWAVYEREEADRIVERIKAEKSARAGAAGEPVQAPDGDA